METIEVKVDKLTSKKPRAVIGGIASISEIKIDMILLSLNDETNKRGLKIKGRITAGFANIHVISSIQCGY